MFLVLSAPVISLTAWTQVNQNGFRQPDSQVYCQAVYNGKLFAGTDYAASVWRHNSGTSWSKINSDGFGNPGNGGAQSMQVFSDKLYVGTSNAGSGTEIWTWNGASWAQANIDGFGAGASLYECRAMTIYNSKLYACASSNGGKFRVYEYVSGTTWNQVGTTPWDSNNHVAMSLMSFNGQLWVGSYSANGCEVWQWNGVSWNPANTDGFSHADQYCWSLHEHNGRLYAGTGASPTKGKVYRFNSGTSWAQIGSNGLGDGNNVAVYSLISIKGKLYAGTANTNNGCQIRSNNGSSWDIEASDGFGGASYCYGATVMTELSNHLYVGTQGTGAQVWSTDGSAVIPYTLYLAEGSTLWLANCSCYVSVENPNTTAVTVKLTYMTPSGAKAGPTVAMPAKSQATINPADTLGKADFSTKVECLEGKTIAADRTMVWNAGSGEEGHCSTAVTSPATSWYLPEGSSAWGFECWLLIQNPNSKAANTTITYMIEGEGPQTVNHDVPANSRASFSMANDIGQKDASIKVTSNVPVIPERAMYRNDRREGHDSIGTTTPATDYYLAEGATGYDVGYITYVLVQNPQNSPNNVSLTYMTQNGQVAGPSFQMPANSRKTIRLNDQLPLNTDVSTRVHGSKPIIAERAMYWNNGTGEACHDSIGMSAPHKTFYLPDGQTSEGRETWTLVQNPNPSVVTVEVTYMTSTGTGNVTKTESIPANSRKTFNMLEHSGINGRASIMVRTSPTGKKIMVERAMYWNNRGAGTDTIGGFGD
jgi:hypothetical protein